MNIAIDLIGAALSIISSYFYIKEKPVAWLISLVAIPMDMFMDLRLGIYGDLFLQFIYFILLIYGWHQWRKGEIEDNKLPIIRPTSMQISIFILVILLPISITWYGLTYYLSSEVALLDSTVTILSLAAQWLLCRKIITSWLLWMFVDLAYVALFTVKFTPFHASMDLIDAVMCIIGYVYWSRELRGSQTAISAEGSDLSTAIAR